jgi:formylglycine-generating enzyme required for sulfatase activity/dienelactone hydrolase
MPGTRWSWALAAALIGWSGRPAAAAWGNPGRSAGADTSYVRIPRGAFAMGCVPGDRLCQENERPALTARLETDLLMRRTEITIGEYRRFAEASEYRTMAEREGNGRRWDLAAGEWRWVRGLDYLHPLDPSARAPVEWPAVQLSPADAEVFCRWEGGRLPTETEWERAARGGIEGEAGPWSRIRPPRAPANGPDRRTAALISSWEHFADRDDGFQTLAPVASFPENPYGLHDMIGNAYEWTADAYRPSLAPGAAPDSAGRVIRGGSWGYYPWHHRYSWRGVFESSGMWTATIGARCVRDVAALDGVPTISPAPLWGGLEPGPFAVGFTILEISDSSRLEGGAPRPLQVSLWYPALGSRTPRLLYGDYVAAYADRESYIAEAFPRADRAAVDWLLATPTGVRRDAPALVGRHPLIVYAPGLGGTPLTHTPMLEYLASHGFAVTSLPATGPARAAQTYDSTGQEAIAGDVAAALGRLARDRRVDARRVLAAGFSFGGNAALLLAARDRRVVAVASLDGSITFQDGHPLLDQAAGFAAGRVRVPVLAVTSASASEADLAMLRRLDRSDRIHVAIPGLEHHDVIAAGIISSRVAGEVPRGAYGSFHCAARGLRELAEAALLDGRPTAALPGLARACPAGTRVERLPAGAREYGTP